MAAGQIQAAHGPALLGLQQADAVAHGWGTDLCSSLPPSNRQPRRYAKQQLVCDTTAWQPADRNCAAR